jgi:hypothetical protein
MKLEENACGSQAVYSMDGRQYSAELRSDGKHGYWRVPGKGPLRGSYEAPEFHFEFQSLVAQSAQDGGAARCRLLQHEVISGKVTVDAGTADEDAGEAADEGAAEDAGEELDEDADTGPASDLTGEHELMISAEPGDDCREALAPAGAFEKLPCSVRYSLRGTRIKKF